MCRGEKMKKMRKYRNFLYACIVIAVALAFVMPGSAVVSTDMENKFIDDRLSSLDELMPLLPPDEEVPTDDDDITPFTQFIDRTVYRLNNALHRMFVFIYALGNGGRGYIQKAIDRARPGDTVEIPSGVYYENIFIYKPLTLLGEDPETTIIDGGAGSRDDGPPALKVVKITSDDVTISGFTIQNGESSGISARSSNLEISNNIVTQNRGSGIGLSKPLDIVLDEYNILVHENTISYNDNMGITGRYCEYVEISENDIHNNGGVGIQFLDSSNIIVSENTVNENLATGIHIWLSSDCQVVGNIVTNTSREKGWGTGIKISGVTDCIVSGNQVIDNAASGIYVYANSNICTIENNFVAHNCYGTENAATGIMASGGDDYIVTENTIIDHPRWSLCLYDMSGIVSKNTVSNNGGGIALRSQGKEIIITENTIADSDFGAFTAGGSSGAKIFYNNFINNNGGIVWDDYAYNLYDWNYWSEYDGVDSDGDGIGDEKLTKEPIASWLPIDEIIIDNYPFMAPNGWIDYEPPVEPLASFIYTPSHDLEKDIPIQFMSTSTDSDGTIIEQQWQFGETAEWVIVDNPIHIFEEPDVYVVSLKVIDNDGHVSGIYSRTVTVDPLIPQIYASRNLAEGTLTVTGGVFSGSTENYLWSDFFNTGSGTCTLPSSGHVHMGDVITDCTGHIRLEYTNGAIAGEWFFE